MADVKPGETWLDRVGGEHLMEARSISEIGAKEYPLMDHLFETIPATRKFIGGMVGATKITISSNCVAIDPSYSFRYAPPAEARLLAAALIAAADAIEGKDK